MAFFAKSRRKLRTKNFEAHFHRKLRTLEKCSNVKKLRTTEPHFSGSYKKQSVHLRPRKAPLVYGIVAQWPKQKYPTFRRAITLIM